MKTEDLKLIYYAKIVKSGDGFVLTFRDFPGFVIAAPTVEEVLTYTTKALDLITEKAAEKDITNVVTPSEALPGEYPIYVNQYAIKSLEKYKTKFVPAPLSDVDDFSGWVLRS